MDERQLVTIRFDRKLYKKLKILAIREDTTVQDLIHNLAKKSVSQYEKEKGDINL